MKRFSYLNTISVLLSIVISINSWVIYIKLDNNIIVISKDCILIGERTLCDKYTNSICSKENTVSCYISHLFILYNSIRDIIIICSITLLIKKFLDIYISLDYYKIAQDNYNNNIKQLVEINNILKDNIYKNNSRLNNKIIKNNEEQEDKFNDITNRDAKSILVSMDDDYLYK